MMALLMVVPHHQRRLQRASTHNSVFEYPENNLSDLMGVELCCPRL
jgi:hypothetical protein